MPKKWNIVFITSDEHNAKMVGYDGYPDIKTPALDRLAKEGMALGRAYAAFPLCSPARQSIYTGLYPQEHGQVGNGIIFPQRNETWAHHFKRAGYKTAIIGKTHDNNTEYQLGFDLCMRNDVEINLKDSAASNDAKLSPGRVTDEKDALLYKSSPDRRFSGQVLSKPTDESDGVVIEESLKYLREHKDEKFFLHVSMTKPHWPWNAPKEYYYMYDPERIAFEPVRPDAFDDNPVPRARFFGSRWNELTEEQNRLYRARYYGSLSWMDSNIGLVLDELDTLGLSDHTLVMYTSDHGDMAGEKGLWLKGLMYEGSARIPAVIRMPGVIPQGSRADTLFNQVDIYPTLAGLTGSAELLPDTLSGVDLSAALLGKKDGPEYTYSVEGADLEGKARQTMVRSKRYKFCWYPNEEKQYVLYDMEKDPEETKNIAYEPASKETVETHLQEAKRFLESRRLFPYEVTRLNRKSQAFIKEKE